MKRGFQNVSRLRRKLRKMPEDINGGVKKEIKSAAVEIERDMLGMVPVDEGDLADVISHKVGRDGFSAVIGPGAHTAQFKFGMRQAPQKLKKDGSFTLATERNNNIRFQFYKAHWMEFGTKHHAQRKFIEPAWDVNKDKLAAAVRAAVNNAVEMAADG